MFRERDINARAVPIRFNHYCVTQPPADHFAEVQADAARVPSLLASSGHSRVSRLKDAREILGRDADSRVAHAESVRRGHEDADFPLARVFESVRKHLTDDEAEPFAVGQDSLSGRREVERYLPVNEL